MNIIVLIQNKSCDSIGDTMCNNPPTHHHQFPQQHIACNNFFTTIHPSIFHPTSQSGRFQNLTVPLNLQDTQFPSIFPQIQRWIPPHTFIPPLTISLPSNIPSATIQNPLSSYNEHLFPKLSINITSHPTSHQLQIHSILPTFNQFV